MSDFLDAQSIEAIRRAVAACDPSTPLIAFARWTEAWLDDPVASEALPEGVDERPLHEMLTRIVQKERAVLRKPGSRPEKAVARARVDRGRRWIKVLASRAPPLNEGAATEEELRSELLSLEPEANRAVANSGAGQVTVEWRERTEELLGIHRRLLERAAPGGEAARIALGGVAHLARSLGRCCEILGSPRDAITAYEEAARSYRAMDDEERAAEASDAAEKVRRALAGDFAGTAIADLKALAENQRHPLARAHIAIRLARQAADTNDLQGAGNRAESALAALAEAGFPDPSSAPMPAIAAAWLDALQSAPDIHFITQLGEITGLAMQALTHRGCAQIVVAPQQGRETRLIHLTFGRLAQEMMRHAMQAAFEIREELRPYMPELPASLMPQSAGFDESMDIRVRLAELLDEMLYLDDIEALELEASRILEMAKASGPPGLIVQAYIARSTILLKANRLSEAEADAKAGEAVLFGGESEGKVSIDEVDMDFLLQLRWVRLHAAVLEMRGGDVLLLGIPIILLIERARHSISNPVQQSVFLTRRTFVYESVAMAAFKLKNWDLLIEVADLFKARATVRNRLVSAVPEDVSQLQTELLSVSLVLARATTPEDRATLRRRRNELWDRVAASRWQTSADGVPSLSVKAVQEALDPDEAMVSWTWVSHNVLLVMAIDQERLLVEGVVLSDEQQRAYEAYVAAAREGLGYSRDLTAAIETIGDFALPPDIRAFIAGARRLKLSPHRGLHLVPFHALRLGEQFLIQRMAVSYVPNVASVLLPWTGSADGPTVSIGINEFPGSDQPTLQEAEQEARDISDLWSKGGAKVIELIGPTATVEAFQALPFERCRCLHLATHGSSVYADDTGGDPFESRLYLSDGYIDALTIGQLPLGAEVVVMSACHSGQRAMSLPGVAELPGDDLFGLTAAWFQAGARAVIGALWPLDDSTAGVILPILHRRLAAGAEPDIALQAAICDYLGEPGARRDMFFWAPIFVSLLGSIPNRIAAPSAP